MSDFEAKLNDPHSRRTFLTRMAAAGLGVAALGLVTPTHASGRTILEIVNVPDDGTLRGIPGRNKNIQVLNYALTLETLEADLYRQALNLAAGKPISTALPDDVSSYTLSIAHGGLSDTQAQLGFSYLQQFAAVEAAHRDFLRAAITAANDTPVGPNPGGYQAPFGSDLRSILTVISKVEETGVRAYLGAAQSITDLKLVQTAASIYSTEARHSAAINYVLQTATGPVKHRLDSEAVVKSYGQNNFEYFQTPEQILTSVKPFLV